MPVIIDKLSSGGTAIYAGYRPHKSLVIEVPIAQINWIPSRIVKTPGILGGKARIANRRIGVDHIVVWHHRLGLSIDAIAREYDLSPSDVQAALDYYISHRAEVDASIRAADEVPQHRSSLSASDLRKRLGE